MSGTTLEPHREPLGPDEEPGPARLALVLVWDRRSGERVGEVAVVLPGRSWALGRVGGRHPDRLRFARPGPGDPPATALANPFLSRDQLVVEVVAPGMLEVSNLGRLGLRVNGAATGRARVRTGDVLELEGEQVFLVVSRRSAPPDEVPRATPFGAPDEDGIVGESAAIGELRRRIARVADQPGHVMVTGGSGSGKELVARALHRRSGRAGPLVTCNAAAVPPGLAEAEWFGNRKDYPNPGMPARRGFAGEADGGTLLIDEIGELPSALQAQLLRLLDSGEVQRLGEPRPGRVDVRVLAATHRPLSTLNDDLLARFPNRLAVPGLADRPEDVPLLVNHLLARVAGTPFLEDGVARVTPALWTALLRHRWTLGVRELHRVLSAAIVEASGAWLAPSPALGLSADPVPAELAPVSRPDELGRDEIAAALTTAGGNKSEAARLLGLTGRHQLRRLLLRHGLG